MFGKIQTSSDSIIDLRKFMKKFAIFSQKCHVHPNRFCTRWGNCANLRKNLPELCVIGPSPQLFSYIKFQSHLTYFTRHLLDIFPLTQDVIENVTFLIVRSDVVSNVTGCTIKYDYKVSSFTFTSSSVTFFRALDM